jgi:hypothetical protein
MRASIYRWLFVVSIGINVVLGILLFQASANRPAKVSKEGSFVTRSPDAPLRIEAAPATNSDPKRFDWKSVESADYQTYLANLRAEETIRDIIRADVTKLYDEKKRAVRKESPKFEYWKGDSFIRGVGREAWTKMLALDEERDGVLRALGIEPDYRKTALKKENAKEWMLEFLSDEKKEQIARMTRELENRLATRDHNSLSGEQIQQLWREHGEAVKRLLTSEEALQYDLRMSPLAGQIRNEARAFDVTETEFIELYKLHEARAREAEVEPGNAAAAERRAEQFQEQIRQALGPERYAAYDLARDPRYQSTYVFATENGLGSRQIQELHDTIKTAEQAVARIRNDPSIAAERRTEALEGIRRETERALQTKFGETVWQQYQSRGYNHWLGLMTNFK